MTSLKRELLETKLQLERAEELINLYRHDALTGLKLRRDFELKFTEFFDSGVDFFITMVDVNGLHTLNREENYDAGDRLIRYVANKFMSCSHGIVYRIGGDEFVSLSLTEPLLPNDSRFIGASICSKNYKSEKSIFDAVDRKVIKLKAEFYKNREYDRRGNLVENTPETNLKERG